MAQESTSRPHLHWRYFDFCGLPSGLVCCHKIVSFSCCKTQRLGVQRTLLWWSKQCCYAFLAVSKTERKSVCSERHGTLFWHRLCRSRIFSVGHTNFQPQLAPPPQVQATPRCELLLEPLKQKQPFGPPSIPKYVQSLTGCCKGICIPAEFHMSATWGVCSGASAENGLRHVRLRLPPSDHWI